MITCGEIISFIEKSAPLELAEEWDNIGLLVGNRENYVNRILVCLDITSETLAEAINKKVDLIITHHPVIFKGIKKLNEDEIKGKLLYSLIRNNISVYAAHTNLDFAVDGVNTHLALLMGINDAETLAKGPGKVGQLEYIMTMNDFIKKVKAVLNVPHVRVAGKPKSGIQKVAVFSGSFDDDLEAVIHSGADVLVTGDLKYHTALDAREAGLCIVDAGHFNTEKIILPVLAALLKGKFQEIQILTFLQEEDPFITY